MGLKRWVPSLFSLLHYALTWSYGSVILSVLVSVLVSVASSVVIRPLPVRITAQGATLSRLCGLCLS